MYLVRVIEKLDTNPFHGLKFIKVTKGASPTICCLLAPLSKNSSFALPLSVYCRQRTSEADDTAGLTPLSPLPASLPFAELCREVSGWNAMNFAEAYDLPCEGINDTVPRVDVQTTSIGEFRRHFESQYKPVVLSRSQDGWLAEKKWTLKVRFLLRLLTFDTRASVV